MNEKMPERVYIRQVRAGASIEVWSRDRDFSYHALGTEYIRADLYDQAIKDRDEAVKWLDYATRLIQKSPALDGQWQSWVKAQHTLSISRLAQKGAER